MKDFKEREDFLPGRALSEDAPEQAKRSSAQPLRLRTCDFYALGAVGIQDIFV